MTLRKLQLFLISTILLILTSSQISPEVKKINWVDIVSIDSLKLTNPKPVFIDIRANWCGMCKKFDATTLQEHEVIEMLNKNFHPVHFDFHEKRTFTLNGAEYAKEGEFNSMAKHFEATGLPTFVFLDKDLNTIEIVQGYQDKKEFLKLLKGIIKDYKN